MIIRIGYFLVHALGMFLIYVSLFLHEDEELRIQDRVEEWWVRLDEARIVSTSRTAAFMREVAKLTLRGFDRLFGKKLFSLRFVVISIYLSMASLFLWSIILYRFEPNHGAGTLRVGIQEFVYFALLAVIPALDESWLTRLIWWSVIPFFLISSSGFLAFVLKQYGAPVTLKAIGIVAVPFLASLGSDFAYIALTRLVLRRISTSHQLIEIVVMTLANLSLVVVPILGTVYLGVFSTKFAPRVGAFTVFSILFNLIDALASLAALFLAVLLLVHRLFWPVVQRPLYAVQRFTPIKNRKLLFSIGTVLLLFPSAPTVRAAVKYLLQRFS